MKLNPVYLKESVRKFISRELDTNGFVQLNNFLDKNIFLKLKNDVNKIKFDVEKIPNLHSYSFCPAGEFSKFFKGPIKLIFNISGKLFIDLFKFKWKNYTLLNDSSSSKYDFYFIIKNSLEFKDGGNLVYVLNDNSFVFKLEENSFIAVDKSKGFNGFIKYLSCFSKNKELVFLKMLI